MVLLPADYVLVALATALAVTGLFLGFSGTLAFLAAAAVAGAVAVFGWPLSEECIGPVWLRLTAVLAAALLLFGLVRITVRRLVNGLMAQPADAVFGLLLGALIGFGIIVAWSMSGLLLEYSNIAAVIASSGYLDAWR